MGFWIGQLRYLKTRFRSVALLLQSLKTLAITAFQFRIKRVSNLNFLSTKTGATFAQGTVFVESGGKLQIKLLESSQMYLELCQFVFL